MTALTDTFKLRNGVKIPKVGFGTWQVPDGEVAYNAVANALKAGYRHIDTAWQYQNEKSVGKAIRDSGIPRDQIFVTTKLPAKSKSYDDSLKFFEETMQNLGLDYVDLYLIHAPWPWEEMGADYSKENVEVWRAMEKIYQSGRAKAIGISNFNVQDQKNILENCKVEPMVNQLQYYIGYTEPQNVKFAKESGMLVEAFSPLATGYLLNNDTVSDIAKQNGVTVAQLAIQYCIQHDILPLPKAVNPAHINENKELDFVIPDTDMETLDSLVDTAPGEDHNE
ncbi:aldo/keto reductase [Pediococcus inopinatus]|uniref:aldo/keto reductase n=1 Tax=Pediococcus TaxID=1253 RepID=UPI00070F1C37|nr:aldo/keto reductase [Pediococcus inopinatus]AVL00643.1 2,5-diketo-D-gluconic acid reductase [Pediococcus inopinatus]WPC17045.1 aldo/keto reductase [Pediococcus inopinatus]WPC20537.1 aldo/keto reductase [Pediococcus inopinatus]WPP09530.1 aldo/keto reductase [Pediococcus inopinatus]